MIIKKERKAYFIETVRYIGWETVNPLWKTFAEDHAWTHRSLAYIAGEHIDMIIYSKGRIEPGVYILTKASAYRGDIGILLKEEDDR